MTQGSDTVIGGASDDAVSGGGEGSSGVRVQLASSDSSLTNNA